MKKIQFLFISLFLLTTTYCQKWTKYNSKNVLKNTTETKSEVVRISVSGEAKKLYLPDIMVFDFSVVGNSLNQKQAIVNMQQSTNRLLQRFAKLNFSKSEIKQTSYNITDYIRFCDGNYINKGFTATQGIRVEFNVDINKLSTVFNSFAEEPDSTITFSYNTNFSLNLVEKIREELIEEAIKDANKKVRIICKSSSLSLLNISDISYNNIYQSYSNSLNRADMMAVKTNEFTKPTLPDISMSETEFSQKIDIVYYAK